jgi:hypothetical protein
VAYEKLTRRIAIVPQLSAEVVKAADFIYDPVPTATVASKKQGTFKIEKTFDLHKLYAKGKTFNFTLGEPGLTSRPGAYLHLKNISFTAKRSPFSFADITKVFRALLKL